MQVDLTVNPPSDQNNPVGWRAFGLISRWFGIVAIACAISFFAGLLALLIFIAARETIFALRKLWLGDHTVDSGRRGTEDVVLAHSKSRDV